MTKEAIRGADHATYLSPVQYVEMALAPKGRTDSVRLASVQPEILIFDTFRVPETMTAILISGALYF